MFGPGKEQSAATGGSQGACMAAYPPGLSVMKPLIDALRWLLPG
jgi:hypothetical protein